MLSYTGTWLIQRRNNSLMNYEIEFCKEGDEESEDAKGFWEETEFQQKTYDASPPFYAQIVAKLISRLEPDSVFEFGSNTGRNLQLIKEFCKSETLSIPNLKGVDINRESITYGKRRWNLNLEVSDENYLYQRPDNSSDVVFTISVLDHIPQISEVLAQLARIAGKYLIILEPHYFFGSGRIKSIKNPYDRKNPGWQRATPFSYIHNYEAELFGLTTSSLDAVRVESLCSVCSMSFLLVTSLT